MSKWRNRVRWLVSVRAHLSKSLRKFLCELGGMGDAADVAAGHLDDIGAELAPQNDVHFMGGISTRFPSDGQQDPVGVTGEGLSTRGYWRSSCSNQ